MRNRSPLSSLRLLSSLFLLCAAAASAQPARLVRDIDPSIGSSGLSVESRATAAGSAIYFGARRTLSAVDLWTSDGTVPGTAVVRTMHSDYYDGPPSPVTALGTQLFFVLDARELWVSDGTDSGTRLLRRFHVSAGSELVAAGGTLYFAADDGADGPALWRTDGSDVGTFLVANASGSPNTLTAFDDRLLYFAFDGVGQALWSSDGTAASTVRVSGIGESVEGAAAEDGRLYFFTRSADDEWVFRLWTSDGTDDGTLPIAFFQGTGSGVCPGMCPPPYGPSGLTPLGDGMLFIADGGTQGRQVWRTDGTSAGTQRVHSVAVESGGLQRAGDIVFFGADDGVHGYELWKTDGTEAGTSLVRDVSPGPEIGTSCCGLSSGALGNRVVYGGTEGSLWWSDGTASGTEPVASIGSGFVYPRDFVDVPGSLFFYIGIGSGVELWRTDGSASGTMRLDSSLAPASSAPYFLVDAGGRLFFSALEDGQYRSLWTSNGTESGTAALSPRFELVGPASFVTTSASLPLGGRLFFTADDGVHGYEIWVTDGASDTHLVEDIAPGHLGSAANFLGSVGESAIFAAYTDQFGLWATDGTEGGTRPVGAASVVFETTGAVLGGRVFFAGFDAEHGGEPWVTDGTDAGTRLVKDIHPGPGYSQIYAFAESQGLLYFAAFDGETRGLWKTDGTPAGTIEVASLPESGYGLVGAGGLIYFTTYSGLWRSDGTEAGTFMIREGYAAGLVSWRGFPYFMTADGEHGWELWTSDGTEDGTVLVRDVRPGEAQGVLGPLTVAGDRLVFAADDGEHGVELWQSDGTSEGTAMVQDLASGPASSDPGRFTVSGQNLFFVADDGFTGAELWAIPLSSLAPHAPRALSPALRPEHPTRELPPRP
jgi:ELWxxDGT repeat protein